MMQAIRKMTWVELKLLVREPFTVLFVFVFPIVVLLVLSGVFGAQTSEEWNGTTPVNYYVAAYIGTVITALALVSIPVHLASYRERGILRRFIASSVSPHVVLVSQLLVGLLLATVGAIVLVITAALVYDIDAPANIPDMIVSFTIGTLSFVAFGLLLGVIIPTARSAQAIGLGLFFPMWMLSGTGPPPEVMTDTMQSISRALPMTRLVNALQSSWFGDGADVTELAILLAILLIAGAIAMYRIQAVE